METLEPIDPTAGGREILTVSQLNREVRGVLEDSFPRVWVEGEISNLARPASGHWYFSLKDSAAQVRCAMFRQRNRLLRFSPRDGMQVLAHARVSLYETRGEFQLIVDHIEEAGDGALRRAFEELKQRLAREGLFDTAGKASLPPLPRRIGVVTSPTGAAIRDVLHVLRRRFPAIPVLIYPVPVQGTGAAAQIAAAIRLAELRGDCDVLIVARGGGSLEDLWAFNEEVVARAIHECRLPVVVGVGHEIDFTIADFAADQRAPTPSAAAELVSPDAAEWLAQLRTIEQQLVTQARRQLRQAAQQIEWLRKRLEPQHPGRRLLNLVQRMDELDQRLRHAQRIRMRHAEGTLAALAARLYSVTPRHQLERLRERRLHLSRRLGQAMNHRLDFQHRQLATLVRALEAVSPLATLSRGYSIVQRLPDRQLVRSAQTLAIGDQIEARFGQGRAICRVEQTNE